jgi:hypothetical protein
VNEPVGLVEGVPHCELVGLCDCVVEPLRDADTVGEKDAATVGELEVDGDLLPVPHVLPLSEALPEMDAVTEVDRVGEWQKEGVSEAQPEEVSDAVGLVEGVPHCELVGLRDCVAEPLRDADTVGERDAENVGELEVDGDLLPVPHVLPLTEALPEMDAVTEVDRVEEWQTEGVSEAQPEGVSDAVGLVEGVPHCELVGLCECVVEPLRDAVNVTVWECVGVGQARGDGDKLAEGDTEPDHVALAIAVGVSDGESDAHCVDVAHAV